MVLRLEGHLFKILSFELHGAAKAGRVVHAKLKNLSNSVVVDRRFRGDEKVENADLESTKMEYLYKEGTGYFFMNLNNYDQVTIPEDVIGAPAKYLRLNSEIFVEYCDGKPVNVVLPKLAAMKIASTGPGITGQADATFKEAVLENGAEVMVPQFIKEGDVIKVDTGTGRYVDRVIIK